MPTVVTNPLGEMITGMLQGAQLAQQIKHQAMQQEAHQRMMARDEREAQLQDIEAENKLMSMGRPVENGGITESFNYQLPSMIPGAGGDRSVSYSRPVDKSRLRSYKTRDGRNLQVEAYTQDEAMKRDIERATASKAALQGVTTAGKIDELRAIEGLRNEIGTQVPGLPGNYLGTDLARIGPTILRNSETAANRTATDARNTANIASREKVAGENRAAADKRATDAAKSREKIAAGRNATTLQAADKRGNGLTPNAQGVQERYDRREMERLQKEEGDLHTQRASIGQQLTNGEDADGKKIGDGKAKLLGTSLKTATDKVQAIQYRKAKLLKITTPPDSVASKIPEGKTATSPDGHTWKKQDGVVYLVN